MRPFSGGLKNVVMKKKDVDEFFKEVQKEANYIDLANIRPIYYAILRAILNNLRDSGSVRLPDWGEFRVVAHKARKSRDPNLPGQYLHLPEIKTVKFSPIERLREYVKNLKDIK